MNVVCCSCQTSFTLGTAEKVTALRKMHSENLNHYGAHCPSCGRTNAISRQRLEMFTPGWQQAIDKPDSQLWTPTDPIPTAQGSQSEPQPQATAQSLEECLNFDDADLGANRFRELSDKQRARLVEENLRRRKSSRSTGFILLAVSVLGALAAFWLLRDEVVTRFIVLTLFQGIIIAAVKLRDSLSKPGGQFQLASAEGLAIVNTSGPTPLLIPYNDYYRDLYIGAKKFRADKTPVDAIREGYEYAVYFYTVKGTDEISTKNILSAELLSKQPQLPARGTVQDLLLKDYFGFDEDDLQANRTGQMTENQLTRRASTRRLDRELALILGIDGIVTAPLFAFRFLWDPARGHTIQLGGLGSQVAGMALAICGILLLTYSFISPLFSSAAKAEGKVASVRGRVQVRQPEHHNSGGGTTYSPYELLVGDQKFFGTLKLKNLMDGGTYIIYYVDGSRDIVAAEPVLAQE